MRYVTCCAKQMIDLSAQAQAMAEAWFKQSFLGQAATLAPPQLRPEKQGYGACTVNRSLEDTPLRIGRRTFGRGLAVHAESVVTVTLPAAGKRLTAKIGRDQNPVIATNRTELTFGVEIREERVFTSPVFHGGEAPLAVEVPLQGAAEFVLRAESGANWGHADWAEARVELEDGRRLWLDELPLSGAWPQVAETPPFSFVYGGTPSADLLSGWRRRATEQELDANRRLHVLTFTDPATGLEVVCEALLYRDFPAMEWVVHFKNNGAVDTPILENVQGLDVGFDRAAAGGEYRLHHAVGSVCAANDFQPLATVLAPKGTVTLSALDGRSSSGTLPFFNLEAPGGGVIGAVGWSGQWLASFARDEATGLAVRAGLERTHFTLHPGEGVRGPRMLLLFWRGDRLTGHNRWRQFLLKHYTPATHGQPVKCPISMTFWGMLNEAEQLANFEAIVKKKIPVDTFWIDAGWYGDCQKLQDWYPQAGSWQCNATLYPRGMKPISDAVRRQGLRFLLWFDPERVYQDSLIYREHRDWLLEVKPEDRRAGWENYKDNYLFNLGCDEARCWLTEFISRRITEEGVDVFREDFNLEPLPFWRAADGPDRQGIAEMKYIAGFYAFWDGLRQRHPALLIDNCASGGRRIDLETIQRSVPLWRSDLQCCPDYSATGSQCQTFGLAHWVPMNAAGCRNPGDSYDFRSALSSGISICWNVMEQREFPAPWARNAVREAELVREFHLGDFYPLTEYGLTEDVWLAYQLDRPDLRQGIILAYRRKRCPYPDVMLRLRGLNPRKHYQITHRDTGKVREHTGAELMEAGLKVGLDGTPASVILQYAMK